MTNLNIILFGAPGCGKGTLSDRLVADFGFEHLSAGSILRKEVEEKTTLGLKCNSYMSSGNLIPDDLIIDVVFSHLIKAAATGKGVLLDGFPRTLRQAQELQNRGFKFDFLVFLDVHEKTLRDRCLSRRVDPVTGRIYNLKSDPPPPEIVDRLTIRSDDTREKHNHRMRIYFKQKEDLLAFYSDIVVKVDANGGINKVYRRLLKAVKTFTATKLEKLNAVIDSHL